MTTHASRRRRASPTSSRHGRRRLGSRSRDAFRSQLRPTGARGRRRRCAVYHRGGRSSTWPAAAFDEAGTRPYDRRHAAARVLHHEGHHGHRRRRCACERGLLDYDATVVDYWPEFAAAGKERRHRRPAAVAPGRAARDRRRRSPSTRSSTGTTWRAGSPRRRRSGSPGTAHGYHAVTYGWLAGELVRRVDPQGRSLGGFVADEVAGPVGAEAWIGLPEALEHRVSPLVPSAPPARPGASPR